jgi:hypothetical protein
MLAGVDDILFSASPFHATSQHIRECRNTYEKDSNKLKECQCRSSCEQKASLYLLVANRSNYTGKTVLGAIENGWIHKSGVSTCDSCTHSAPNENGLFCPDFQDAYPGWDRSVQGNVLC